MSSTPTQLLKNELTRELQLFQLNSYNAWMYVATSAPLIKECGNGLHFG